MTCVCVYVHGEGCLCAMCGGRCTNVWREGSACVKRWRLEDAYCGKSEEVISQLILDSPEETDNCLTRSTPFSIDINHCMEEGGRKSLAHQVILTLSLSCQFSLLQYERQGTRLQF